MALPERNANPASVAPARPASTDETADRSHSALPEWFVEIGRHAVRAACGPENAETWLPDTAHRLHVVVRCFGQRICSGQGSQQIRADLSPANQQQRAYGIERGLSVLTSHYRIGRVQCQGDHAREDQQPASWMKQLHGGSCERQVPNAEEEPEDR
jgi:hypothetical protein